MTGTLVIESPTEVPVEAPIELSPAPPAARRGAKLLDEKMPDWYTRINAAELDIANGWHCICGQLYGGFWEGLHALGVKAPTEFGFNASTPVMADLNAAWRDEIARRKAMRYGAAIFSPDDPFQTLRERLDEASS